MVGPESGNGDEEGANVSDLFFESFFSRAGSYHKVLRT
jgi:hypothetical protein